MAVVSSAPAEVQLLTLAKAQTESGALLASLGGGPPRLQCKRMLGQACSTRSETQLVP